MSWNCLGNEWDHFTSLESLNLKLRLNYLLTQSVPALKLSLYLCSLWGGHSQQQNVSHRHQTCAQIHISCFSQRQEHWREKDEGGQKKGGENSHFTDINVCCSEHSFCFSHLRIRISFPAENQRSECRVWTFSCIYRQQVYLFIIHVLWNAEKCFLISLCWIQSQSFSWISHHLQWANKTRNIKQ